MNIFEKLLADTAIPRVARVRYHILANDVGNVAKAVQDALRRPDTLDRISDGQSVAIAVGSREIGNIQLIVSTLVEAIKQQGGQPFIVPAMGSHGGATASGQEAVLADFGITEASLGVPIRSSMTTIELGETQSGIPVHLDQNAWEADCIIPVGRIKPHTDFRGPVESGLTKMLAIGLGKQKGASICHQLGLPNMSEHIRQIADFILERARVPFGLGIIENAFHGTYKIVAVPAELIAQEEPLLLNEARQLIPAIQFAKVDVIVVDEMGKNFSGTGMDSNVIGRSSMLGEWAPFAERIVVLDLTDKSHHNANGMGLADITTQALFDKISFEETYVNTITCAETSAVKIPVVMPDAELAVKCAIKTCTQIPSAGVRLVRIKNTMAMNEFEISEALIEEAKADPALEIISEPVKMQFAEEVPGKVKDPQL